MSGPLHLMPLTDDQRKALEPLFDDLRTAAASGKPRAIFAQVWHDAAVLKVLNPEEIQHVQKVLGGDGEFSCSAADRMAAARVMLS